MKDFLQFNKKILLYAVIPLLLLAVIIALLKFYFKYNDEGILINVATEIFGIIITILFVNYILQKIEKDKWKSTEKRMANRVQHLVNEAIALQYLAFDLPHFRKSKQKYIDENGNNIFVVRAEKELLPKIDNLIHNIDGKTLESFVFFLKDIESSVTKIFTEFYGRLSPFLFTKLYDLKEVLFYLIDTHTFHTTKHFIDSETFLERYRAGDNIHNESVIKYIVDNTMIMLKIVIEIDNYLRKTYGEIEEKFPFRNESNETV